MSNLKTLSEIWKSADRKPVKVVGAGDEQHAPWRIIGILDNVAWLRCKEDDIDAQFEADRKEWKLHKEKKLVEHWPAIIHDGTNYILTGALFKDYEDGLTNCVGNFIRLATELPPIMIEVDDE